MDLIKKHAILTALALVVGMLLIAWLQPETSGGATLIVTFTLIVFNAIGALLKPKPAKPRASSN